MRIKSIRANGDNARTIAATRTGESKELALQAATLADTTVDIVRAHGQDSDEGKQALAAMRSAFKQAAIVTGSAHQLASA